MEPLPHRYDVTLIGGPDGYAQVEADGLPTLAVAAPLQFDGPGDAWTPEHLLLASVQACYLFTLRAVARASKVTFHALDVHGEGTVDRQDGVTRFTAITLYIGLEVPAGADRDRVQRVLEKTERACLVSASLSTPVRLHIAVHEMVSTLRKAG